MPYLFFFPAVSFVCSIWQARGAIVLCTLCHIFLSPTVEM